LTCIENRESIILVIWPSKQDALVNENVGRISEILNDIVSLANSARMFSIGFYEVKDGYANAKIDEIVIFLSIQRNAELIARG
jgi:hypothetical protein